jgi:hypothetical protein
MTNPFIPKKTEHIIVSCLVGILVGILAGLTIKYPFEVEKLQKYQTFCGAAKVKSIKVGFSGDIYTITCDNGVEVRIR